MNKIKILAVEDNAIHQATLFMLIEKLGYELVAVVDNFADAIAQLLANKPDVVLMDVQIQGDKDGIETAAKVNQLYPCPIIFTTSLTDTQTLQRAKETLPYAYLSKPLTIEKLQSAIELAVYRFAQEKNGQKPDMQGISDGQELQIRDNFFIKEGNLLVKVSTTDILWAEADKDKYCKIVTKDKVFFVRSPLKDIADKLPATHFTQIHRSIVVQAACIDNINDFDNTVMVGKNELPIGKTYKAELLGKLNML